MQESSWTQAAVLTGEVRDASGGVVPGMSAAEGSTDIPVMPYSASQIARTPGPDVPGNNATVAVDTGYEIQIDEEARGDTRKNEPDGFVYNRTGAVYKVKGLGTAPGEQNYTNNQRLAAGVWRSLDITVTDRTYEVLLNGQPATKFVANPTDPAEKFRGRTKTEDPDSGFIGLQVHTGNVAFANIRIK